MIMKLNEKLNENENWISLQPNLVKGTDLVFYLSDFGPWEVTGNFVPMKSTSDHKFLTIEKGRVSMTSVV